VYSANICDVDGLVSRFQANPDFAHWKTVKRIFIYLKGTADYILCYQAPDLRLFGYSYADWGGDPNERKSATGYAFLLNGGPLLSAARSKPVLHCPLWRQNTLLVLWLFKRVFS